MARPPSLQESHRRGGSVLPWQLVAGGFLHFALPAYLVALLGEVLLFERTQTIAAMMARVLPFTGTFLLSYGGAAVFGSIAAAACDPFLRARRDRRAARDPLEPARASERRVADSTREARARFGWDGDVLLQTLRSGRWRHDDARFQALSRDLAEVVRTSTAALTSADAQRRAIVLANAERALRGIVTGLRVLELEASRHDEGDAETVARYVESRYGSDFSGSAT